MAECNVCPNHDEVMRRITQSEDSIKELYDRTNKFAITQERILTKLDALSENVVDIKTKVEALSGRPGTMWDKVIMAAIGAGVASFVSYAIK